MDKKDRFQKLRELGYDIEKKEQPVVIKLQEVLKKKKMTAMTLCKKTGISRQTMNVVIQGKMKPGVDFALKVSKVLEVPVEDIFALNDSAWETLVTEDSQSIYWDTAKEALIERKHVKEIEESEGIQYWDVENEKLIDESTYNTILQEELEKRMEEEIENARKSPGRREEKIFHRKAKEAITNDVESRFPLRFQRVVKNLRPIN